MSVIAPANSQNLRAIVGQIKIYTSQLANWEIYSCPCFCFCPIIGCVIDGATEDSMQARYSWIVDQLSTMESRNELKSYEKKMLAQIKNHRMTDPHWGKVMELGYPHMCLARLIINSALNQWQAILEDIKANIALYESKEGCWECYSTACCLFVPVIGTVVDGAAENAMLRVYNNVWITMEALADIGFFNDGERDMILQSAGRVMTDPHWGRVKDQGKHHVAMLKGILNDAEKNWEQLGARIKQRGEGGGAAGEAPVQSMAMIPTATATAVRNEYQMQEQVKSVSSAPPLASVAPMAPASDNTTLAQKLKQLKDTYDANLITEAEFIEGRTTIIANFKN